MWKRSRQSQDAWDEELFHLTAPIVAGIVLTQREFNQWIGKMHYSHPNFWGNAAAQEDDQQPADNTVPRISAVPNNGPGNHSRNAGRKPKFASSTRLAVFKLMDYHGDLSDDDREWSIQADVERAVRAELGDHAPRAESTLRRYVSKFIAEWRVEKQTRGR